MKNILLILFICGFVFYIIEKKILANFINHSSLNEIIIRLIELIIVLLLIWAFKKNKQS